MQSFEKSSDTVNTTTKTKIPKTQEMALIPKKSSDTPVKLTLISHVTVTGNLSLRLSLKRYAISHTSKKKCCSYMHWDPNPNSPNADTKLVIAPGEIILFTFESEGGAPGASAVLRYSPFRDCEPADFSLSEH